MLIVQSPLQQGLKPNGFRYSFFGVVAYRTKSITTRIETYSRQDWLVRLLPHLIVQSPLQQGLKLMYEKFVLLCEGKLIVQSPLQQGLKRFAWTKKKK